MPHVEILAPSAIQVIAIVVHNVSVAAETGIDHVGGGQGVSERLLNAGCQKRVEDHGGIADR